MCICQTNSFISFVWLLIIIIKYVTVFIIVKHVLGIVKNLSIFNFRVGFLLLLYNNFSSTKVNSFLEINILFKHVFFSPIFNLLSQNSLTLTSASISSNSLANASIWTCEQFVLAIVAGPEGGHRVWHAGNGHGWAHLGQYSAHIQTIFTFVHRKYFEF